LALLNANCQYSLIFWLLIHLNTLKIKIKKKKISSKNCQSREKGKVSTFPFSRLWQFLELMSRAGGLLTGFICLEVKCSLIYGQLA